MGILAILLSIVLLLSLTGLIFTHFGGIRHGSSRAAASLRRAEPVLAGSFAAAFILIFVLGVVSSLQSTWKRQEQAIRVVKEAAPSR